MAVHPRDLRRRILTGIFLLVLIWIGLGVWSAIKGVRAALDARDGIDLLLEEYEPEDIARGEADAALGDVLEDVDLDAVVAERRPDYERPGNRVEEYAEDPGLAQPPDWCLFFGHREPH